jgi:hypothetical protein
MVQKSSEVWRTLTVVEEEEEDILYLRGHIIGTATYTW